MLTIRYRYELRHQEKTLATGHLSREQQLQIGDRIEMAARSASSATSNPYSANTHYDSSSNSSNPPALAAPPLMR